jgi:leader peptidase (prepilin peptidase)/N-methyltransferase
VLFPAIVITFIYRLFGNLVNSNWILNSNFKFQISNYLLAALIASSFFLIIFLISRGRAMGFGDVKLAVLMGLLLGLPNVLVALFLAFLFGAIIGVILMVFKKKSLKSEIPFGPFLIAGTFIAMLYGNQIIQWYLNFFQI